MFFLVGFSVLYLTIDLTVHQLLAGVPLSPLEPYSPSVGRIRQGFPEKRMPEDLSKGFGSSPCSFLAPGNFPLLLFAPPVHPVLILIIFSQGTDPFTRSRGLFRLAGELNQHLMSADSRLYPRYFFFS